MALTPEQIAQLRGEAGLSPIAPPKGVNNDDIIAQRKARLGIVDAKPSVAEMLKPSFQRAGKDITAAGEKIQQNIAGEGEFAGQSPIRRGVQATAEAFATPAKVASEFLPEQARTGIEKVNEVTGKVVNWLSDKLGSIQLAQDFVTKHPDAAKTLEEIAGTTGALGETAGNILAIEGGVRTAKNIGSQTKEALSSLESKKQIAAEGKKIASTGEDLMAIKKKIQPKPTAKEARLAMEQGRLYEGTEGSLFKEGKPGGIAASEQQARSVNTIKKYVPDAGSLDPNTLYTEIKNNVGEISKKLKPEMQKVPIKPETVSKMAEDWKALKAEQSGPFAPKGVIKPMQAHFEEVLKSVKSGTIDDIWEAAKKYDDSVPDRVKNATELSDSVLQTQKDIWLDNRRILRDAINDMENGLGQISRQAFAEMRDLYEAQNGLLTKAIVETVGKPSGIQKVIEKYKTPLKVGAGVVGGAGALEVARKAIGL